MDTIFALASAPGKSGVAVVRVSGPHATAAGRALAGSLPEPRRAGIRRLRSAVGETLDEALVLSFEGPNSFTGEDCIEFHVHGSPAIVSAVLSELSGLKDLRLAEPGEFTRRALENDRLNLAQVEGLADLIESETEVQRKQALRVFSGRLGEKVEIWRADLIRAIALLEVTIDFADEEVPEDVYPEVSELLQGVYGTLKAELDGSFVAERIRNGFEVVILGAPNIGKSTLLNALAGRDAAITSHIAGTTRDVVEVRMDVAGLPVTILDTAGLRETEDEIEQLGIQRALARAEAADFRLILIDERGFPEGLTRTETDLVVRSKADLHELDHGLSVSGKTGQGVDTLVAALQEKLSGLAAGAGTATHLRHRVAIKSSLESLSRAQEGISSNVPVELMIQDLRQALVELESLIGRIGIEQVLDEIFSSFCLGK